MVSLSLFSRKDWRSVTRYSSSAFEEFSRRLFQQHMGSVAQELREYDQARNDYQQALQIFIEFDDRYSQASTYFMLGSLAEAEENRSEARANFQQAIDFGFVILDWGRGRYNW